MAGLDHFTPVSKACLFKTCTKEFLPTGLGSKFCPDAHLLACSACGKEFLVARRNYGKPPERCRECHKEIANEKRRNTNLATYGVDNPTKMEAVREKIKETSLKRYGTENPAQSLEVKERIKQTNLETYGVENVFQMEDVKAKIREKNLENLGVEYPGQSHEVQAKMKESMVRLYGVDHPSRMEEVKEKKRLRALETYGVENVFQAEEIKAKLRETNRKRLGVAYPTQSAEVREKVARKYQERLDRGEINPKRVSKENLRWKALLEKRFCLDVVVEFGLGEFAVDLHLAGTRLLLDVNPTVTHNSYLSFICLIKGCLQPCDKRNHEPIAEDYHHKRAVKAKEMGYDLLQIFDWHRKDEVLDKVSCGLLMDQFPSNEPARQPRLAWSRGKTMAREVGVEKELLLSAGWLPVWTAGEH